MHARTIRHIMDFMIPAKLATRLAFFTNFNAYLKNDSPVFTWHASGYYINRVY